MTTTGDPTPALTESGDLPPTFTFTDNGDGTATIAGNPPADADVGTDDPVTITASSDSGTATQSFTLTLQPPLSLVGPSSYRAADGATFNLDIFTPENLPDVTMSTSGTLPAGVVFIDIGDGSSTIQGMTNVDGSEDGVYTITVTAHDGIEPDVSKTVVLTIEPPSDPGITSPPSVTVAAGQPFSFTVTSSGAPIPVLAAQGIGGGLCCGLPPPPFPDGVSFIDNEDGTGTISGTAQTPGTYNSQLVAMSTGPNIPGFVQPFTLNVVQATQPSFTSAATATALVGNPFSFTVTTSGPTPALTESGDLPPTFTFTDNGDGTATIAGNPPADADVGQYNPVTITATNAEGTATQSFTLTVKPPLAIHGPTSFTAADGVFFDVEPLAEASCPSPA